MTADPYDDLPHPADVIDMPAGAREVHRGQLRIAERLAVAHVDQLLHVTGLGWHRWDGHRWILDDAGAATRAVMATLKRALRDAVEMDKDARASLQADVRRCESASGVEGVLRLAAALPEFAATIADLDRDPFLLNTPDGTVDLSTGQVRDSSPSDRITKITGAGYSPGTPGPVWERFLAQVLPDAAVRDFVQRLMGIALIGHVREHVLPILTGTGRNGKSTFVNAVVASLGDYAINAEPELLVERDRAHPTGNMDLRGARLAVCQETDDGRRLAVATVKRLTGGDKIRARRMRQDFVEFTPSHLAVLVTNHLPSVPGDDPALWRRLRVVPFDVVVDPVDTGLPDRLALELPAVLAWAVAGYQQYLDADGLSEPPAVLARTNAYQLSADALGRFLDERCLTGAAYYAAGADLWHAWTTWCTETGEKPGTSQRAFSDQIEARGHTRRRTKRGVVHDGLALAATDTDDDPTETR